MTRTLGPTAILASFNYSMCCLVVEMSVTTVANSNGCCNAVDPLILCPAYIWYYMEMIGLKHILPFLKSNIIYVITRTCRGHAVFF